MIPDDPAASTRTLLLDELLASTARGDAGRIAAAYAPHATWRCVDAEPERIGYGREEIVRATVALTAGLPALTWTRGLVIENDGHLVAFLSAAHRDESGKGRVLHVARRCRFDAANLLVNDDLFLDFGAIAKPPTATVGKIETITNPRVIASDDEDVEQRNVERLRGFYDAVNDHRTGKVAEVYRNDARLIDPNAGDVVHGRKAIVSSFEQIWSAMPAHRAEPLRFVAAGNLVVSIHVVTLDPPRRDPAAKRPRQIEELVLFEMKEDRIASEWTFFNSERIGR